MESTSQTIPTTAPQASPTQTVAAPSLAYQPATSESLNSQVPQTVPGLVMPQAAPQGQAPVYPQAAAPQASAQQGNPWQQAFQALSASLNTPQASQAPAQYSAYQTPTPQANTQASFNSTQGTPTYVPQASTQAYSAQEVQALLSQQQNQLLSQAQSASGSDSYLSAISDTSLEVLEHFGSEAPALLNNYACAVEDALIEQVGRNQSMNVMLDAASEERAAMNVMLTDPDVLADYVNGFFGPEGPYPTLTDEEQQQVAQEQAREQFEQEIVAQEQRNVPASFQRPTMDMPTPNRSEAPERTFWGDFSSMMDNNPEQAWQFLAQAPQQAFQQKMLVQDY